MDGRRILDRTSLDTVGTTARTDPCDRAGHRAPADLLARSHQGRLTQSRGMQCSCDSGRRSALPTGRPSAALYAARRGRGAGGGNAVSRRRPDRGTDERIHQRQRSYRASGILARPESALADSGLCATSFPRIEHRNARGREADAFRDFRETGIRTRGFRSLRNQSGCPDSNWGPLRPERSALPGCATPRARKGYRLRKQTAASSPEPIARPAGPAVCSDRDGSSREASRLTRLRRD